MVAPEKERNYQNNGNNNMLQIKVNHETTNNVDLTLIVGHYAPGF